MKPCAWCSDPLPDERRKYHPDCAKLVQRDRWLQKVYGITLAQYDAILEYQGGVCAICGRPPKSGRNLHVDHEHGGGVRGLLDFACNKRIGRSKSADWFWEAANYMTEPPAVAVLGETKCPGRPRKKRQPRKQTRGKRKNVRT